MKKLEFNILGSRIPILAAMGLVIFSLLIMLNWMVPYIKFFQLTPFHTAAAFVICGLSLILWIKNYRLAAGILGLIVTLFATSTLFIDYDFFNSGVMPLKTSICFIIIGVTLSLQNLVKYSAWQFLAVRVLGWVIFALSIVTIIGYLGGLPNMFGWSDNMMTRTAAFSFLVLSLAILTEAWHIYLKEVKNGKSTPWLPLPIFICTMTFSICLFFALQIQERANLKTRQGERANHLKRELNQYILEEIDDFARMVRRYEIGKKMTKNQWELETSIYLEQMQGLESVALLNSSYELEYFAGNKSLQMKEFHSDLNLIQKLKESQNKKTIIFYNSKDNSASISIYFSLLLNNQFSGFLIATFNKKQILADALGKNLDETDGISIWDNNELLYGKAPEESLKRLSQTVPLNLGDLQWDITAAPTLQGIKKSWSVLPYLALLIGSTAALIIIAALYFYYKARDKNIELQSALAQLHSAKNILQAQEKLASLGTMTAGIAHEIKNPLNLINNFSDISQDILEELLTVFEKHKHSFSEEETKEILESFQLLKKNQTTIIEQGKKANNILQRMLAHSRTSPGQLSPTDINLLLEQYLKLSYYGVKGKNPTFSVNFEKDCDPTLGEKRVIAEDLSSVLLNLFNNAYYTLDQKKKKFGDKFTPVISLKTKNYKDKFEITIRDNGDGIAKDAQEKIFTPFYTTKPSGEGTGLGLSLCHNIIVQEHGGSIQFNTKEGEFTEFIITLPNIVD